MKNEAKYEKKAIFAGLEITLKKGRRYTTKIERQVVSPKRDVAVEIVDAETTETVKVIHVRPDFVQGVVAFFPKGVW